MKKRNVFLQLLAALMAAVMLMALSACGGTASSSVASSETELSSESASEPDGVVAPSGDLLTKLTDAKAANADTAGWMKIPNTTIDSAVMQAKDNEYYLDKNEVKKTDVYGSLFADYECKFGDRNALSKNTVIYGHSMSDKKPAGRRFEPLVNYTNLSFVTNNPYIHFSTTSDDMVWKVFAVFYTETKFNYIDPNFKKTDFMTTVNEAKKRSLFIYDVDVNATDKILTLSTCTYKYGGNTNKDQRFVVMARLVRAGEDISQTTANVTTNPSPKQPSFK